jgi:hypothetical protein
MESHDSMHNGFASTAVIKGEFDDSDLLDDNYEVKLKYEPVYNRYG